MKKVKIRAFVNAVTFARWCRSNGIPSVWTWDTGKCMFYEGSKSVAGDTDFGGDDNEYLIRECDLTLVQLYLGTMQVIDEED